ncbi:hypothetical protein [Mycobacterium uberis]|uniref:hypothetical protein n=1 Tax=Mycobacterium uberis TaxID=2162698 RepID=UPI00243642E7|nr:hypothetical protein [Mycobacterium uberis]
MAEHTGSIDVWAALLPEHKIEVVRGLQSNGHRMLVVSDGVNDALRYGCGLQVRSRWVPVLISRCTPPTVSPPPVNCTPS